MTPRALRSLAAPLLLLALGATAPPPQADLLIRGGTVVSGSDAPFTGDVAIRGDRILAVGPHLAVTAARIIEARGMVIAPGFIDPHSHMGGALTSADAARRLVPAFLLQGVTTTFIGNDGGGAPEVGAVLASAEARPVGINYAAYVGFGAVRERVIGRADRAPCDVGSAGRRRGPVGCTRAHAVDPGHGRVGSAGRGSVGADHGPGTGARRARHGRVGSAG